MPLFSILENELSGILVLQSVFIYFGIETFRREASKRPGLRKDEIRKSGQLQPMCPRSGRESAGDTRTHCLSALKHSSFSPARALLAHLVFQSEHLLVPAPPADLAVLHWLLFSSKPSALCIQAGPTH